MPSSSPTLYDAIVIGSGMGALTTAAILAKVAKKKVLVLEKHWTVGGLTHEFERGRRYSWDVGVHYIGQAAGNTLPAKVFRFISEGKLEWERIAAPYDTFVYPDFTFEVPESKGAYMRALTERFPHEARNIRRYFSDLSRVVNRNVTEFFQLFAPGAVSAVCRLLSKRHQKMALMTTGDYFDMRFKDPRLRALLLSQWGDYGVEPSRSSFWIHATIVLHYLDGAYYPKGGSRSIAETVLPTIERAGGAYQLNCEVQEILLEKGKAVGCTCRVRTPKGERTETYYAPLIVSGAGVHTTYRKLLRSPLYPELDAMQSGQSMITVYLGLKRSPAELGVRGGNYWIFESYKHDGVIARQSAPDLPLEMCFASFPSLKDPSKKAHTAELITFLDYKVFEAWRDRAWRDRGEDYEALKRDLADKLLSIADRRLPGFADLVEYAEVSTPLSQEKFTGRQRGMMYGSPHTPERDRHPAFQAKTPIPNLFLTGGDVFAMGIVGALMSGVGAACAVLGDTGFLKVFPRIFRS